MDALTASGPFEVQLSPQPPTEAASQAGLGQMTLNKRFHGPLEAVSSGEMLAFRSGVDGSAGYVAIETVRGTLPVTPGALCCSTARRWIEACRRSRSPSCRTRAPMR